MGRVGTFVLLVAAVVGVFAFAPLLRERPDPVTIKRFRFE